MISHADVHVPYLAVYQISMAVIIMISMCGSYDNSMLRELFFFIKQLINLPDLRCAMPEAV